MNAAIAEFALPSSLRMLLCMRSAAKLARLKRRMLAPRRLVLTVLAVLLGLFWAAQALLGILFRPPADPERLRDLDYRGTGLLRVLAFAPIGLDKGS